MNQTISPRRASGITEHSISHPASGHMDPTCFEFCGCRLRSMLLSPETRLVDIKPSPGPTIMGKRGGGGTRAGFSHFRPVRVLLRWLPGRSRYIQGHFRTCVVVKVSFSKNPRQSHPPPKKERRLRARERERERRKRAISCVVRTATCHSGLLRGPCRRDPSACCWSVSGDGNRPLLQTRAPFNSSTQKLAGPAGGDR